MAAARASARPPPSMTGQCYAPSPRTGSGPPFCSAAVAGTTTVQRTYRRPRGPRSSGSPASSAVGPRATVKRSLTNPTRPGADWLPPRRQAPRPRPSGGPCPAPGPSGPRTTPCSAAAGLPSAPASRRSNSSLRGSPPAARSRPRGAQLRGVGRGPAPRAPGPRQYPRTPEGARSACRRNHCHNLWYAVSGASAHCAGRGSPPAPTAFVRLFTSLWHPRGFQSRTKLVDVGQICATLGHIDPTLAKLVQFGPNAVTCWSNVARDSGNCLPVLRRAISR